MRPTTFSGFKRLAIHDEVIQTLPYGMGLSNKVTSARAQTTVFSWSFLELVGVNPSTAFDWNVKGYDCRMPACSFIASFLDIKAAHVLLTFASGW